MTTLERMCSGTVLLIQKPQSIAQNMSALFIFKEDPVRG